MLFSLIWDIGLVSFHVEVFALLESFKFKFFFSPLCLSVSPVPQQQTRFSLEDCHIISFLVINDKRLLTRNTKYRAGPMGSPFICNAAALRLKASYFLFLSLYYIYIWRSCRYKDCESVLYYILGFPIWSDSTSWSADLVFFSKKPYLRRKNWEKLVVRLTEMSASWGKNKLFHTQQEEEGKQSERRAAMANWAVIKSQKINI